MSIGFIDAMKFPRGYSSKRKKSTGRHSETARPYQVVTASTVQNILTRSKVFLSNQLLKMLKLIVIAMVQLEFVMYDTNCNLFYLALSSKEPMV